MKASLKKRMTAYLIDIIIMLIILGFINILYKPDNTLLNDNLNLLTAEYASGDINFSTYMTKSSEIYKQIDLNNIIVNLINVIYIIGYFIILPYFYNGQTIGKKMMSINVRAVSNKKLTISQLFIRNLIINGLFYLIAVIICSLIIPENYYFITVTAMGIIQIGLILSSMFMVIYRKDKKGLHDLLARTWVASAK